MKEITEKLRSLEQNISEEKGSFLLFALFLREDAPDRWDLLVAAPWIPKNKNTALKYFSNKLVQTLSQKELLKLSRIAIIEPDEPALSAIQQAMHVEHGLAEIKDSNFFGLQIKHAYIITSRRQPDDIQPSASHSRRG
jgi:hypothetical protein